MSRIREITWTHSFLHELLNHIPIDTKRLLDVGCGKGLVGALMSLYRKPEFSVGINIFLPYLKVCQAHRFYDKILQHNLQDYPLPFESKSFDVVTCIELIEHLPKACGLRLLDELDRLATRKIIVTTPNQFFEHEELDQNPYQIHRGKWSTKEFKIRDYKIGLFSYVPHINAQYFVDETHVLAKVLLQLEKCYPHTQTIIATKTL